jgi:tRNA-dihydrouridine synthase B
MIGRAALGNPWIFRRTVDLLEGRPMREPDLDERFRAVMTHCRLLADLVSPERAVYMLRSVLMWYTKGLPDSTTFRQSINQVRDFPLLLESIRGYFSSLAETERIEAA